MTQVKGIVWMVLRLLGRSAEMSGRDYSKKSTRPPTKLREVPPLMKMKVASIDGERARCWFELNLPFIIFVLWSLSFLLV